MTLAYVKEIRYNLFITMQRGNANEYGCIL